MNEFDIYNGFLMEKGEKLYTSANRAFKYGDGVFETIKIFEGEILNWDEHYARLQKGLKVLKIDDSEFPKQKWEDELKKVVYKNYYKYAKLRLTVYRDSPGLYTPMTNKLGYLIEGVRYSLADFSKAIVHKNVGVYEELNKSIDIVSNCKTISALVYVLASIYKKEQGLDDVIVLNSNGKVCESSNSNVFIVKDGEVYTTPLSSGCVEGVMRSVVINRCQLKNINIIEEELTLEHLKNSDELFLTNAIAGIQSVESFLGFQKKSAKTKMIQSFF